MEESDERFLNASWLVVPSGHVVSEDFEETHFGLRLVLGTKEWDKYDLA